jgi:hypothetical protein
VAGLPFIGEESFYPDWAKGAGRWVFQRTIVTVAGFTAGYTELAAARLSVSKQVIVWAPRRRGLLANVFPARRLHEEREAALHELMGFRLICYSNACTWSNVTPTLVRAAVREEGIPPEDWRLLCPTCGSVAGVDLEPVSPNPIVKRWLAVGKPSLDNPAASAAFRSAPPVHDLPTWIAKSDPSHLELAYLGQQMWPTIREMLEACAASST